MAKDFDYIVKLEDGSEMFVEAIEGPSDEAQKARLSAYAEKLKAEEE